MRADLIRSWINRIPDVPEAQGIDGQARALVRDLLCLALEESNQSHRVPSRNPELCPDCGLPVASERSPYCCERCRGEAALVRQLRQALEAGELEQERQIAFGQSLWHLYGGGYPLRQSLIPASALTKVIQQGNGRCAACDAPATTVDHVRTACNRPINLRPVCSKCNRDRPFFDAEVLAGAVCRATKKAIASRTGAEQPLRTCDHAATWDWRAYVAERKALRKGDLSSRK